MRCRTLVLTAGMAVLMALLVVPVSANETAPEAAAIQVARDWLAGQHGIDAAANAVVTDAYTSAHNQVTHVYFRQVVDGTEVRGAEATVNVQDGVVIHAGSRFVDDAEQQASGALTLTVGQAVRAAAEATKLAPTDLHAAPTLIYRKLRDGTARLAYEVQLVDDHHWWAVSVDAETGEALQQVDYVDHESVEDIAARIVRTEPVSGPSPLLDPILADERVEDGSSYRVFPLPMESPLDGDRLLVDNPADAIASPFGWHDLDGVAGPDSTTTYGNNVDAYADTVADNIADPTSRPDGGQGLTFDYSLFTYAASPAVYRDAAVTNLFFWNNVMHDVTYRYGFDEAAGNFQEVNLTGRGAASDAVRAEAQDGSFVLNANFATPPDGKPGRMQMFLWVDAYRDLQGDWRRVHSHEVRDGDLDNGVIAHEYGHGVSNRLVGGPANVECLRTHDEREGEGWSDFWSWALTMRPGDDGATPRGVGNYVVYYDEYGREGPGVRPTPYSTDRRVNPSTYNTIREAAEPHGVGYVWATMLWELYWNLVEERGFNPNPYDAWHTGGNNLAIQLVVDGMKFVPCEPGFVDARDAIIAADAALTGDPANGVPGQNECIIWRSFAKRGLGLSADQGDPASKTDGIAASDVPSHCGTG